MIFLRKQALSITKRGKYRHVERDLWEHVGSSLDLDLNIFTFTWNLGDHVPDHNEITCFLNKYVDVDILALGVQESAYAESRKNTCDWFNRIETIVGDSFYTVAKESSRNSIRLIVLVKKTLQPVIHSVQSDSYSSSSLPVLWRKGANAISFNILNTSLCFINMHLSAHEGNLAMRLLETENILRKLNVGNVNFDISNQFHHLILFGDLNYRVVHLNYDETFPMAYIHQYDQLLLAQQRNKTLTLFKEGPLTFLPTFKKIRGSYHRYKNSRNPSWCDRVLYYSVQGFETHLKLIEYDSDATLLTSDHSPVYGLFNLNIHANYGIPSASLKVYTLDICNIEIDIKNERFQVLQDSTLKLVFTSPMMQSKYIESRPCSMSLISEISVRMATIPLPLDMKGLNDSMFSIALYRCLGEQEIFHGVASFNAATYLVQDEELEFNTDIVWSGLWVGSLKGLLCLKSN